MDFTKLKVWLAQGGLRPGRIRDVIAAVRNAEVHLLSPRERTLLENFALRPPAKKHMHQDFTKWKAANLKALITWLRAHGTKSTRVLPIIKGLKEDPHFFDTLSAAEQKLVTEGVGFATKGFRRLASIEFGERFHAKYSERPVPIQKAFTEALGAGPPRAATALLNRIAASLTKTFPGYEFKVAIQGILGGDIGSVWWQGKVLTKKGALMYRLSIKSETPNAPYTDDDYILAEPYFMLGLYPARRVPYPVQHVGKKKPLTMRDANRLLKEFGVAEMLVHLEDSAQAGKRWAGEISKTILQQLGGWGRLRAMLGVKQALDHGNGVSFRFPNRRGPNHVKILLNGSDTYDVEFGRIRGLNFKVIKEYKGIYADGLADLFVDQTGLHLRMASSKQPQIDQATHNRKANMDPKKMLTQVGEYFKRKYGLDYELETHSITGEPDNQVDIRNLNDEPYYAAGLTVSYDPEDGWDVHIHQGRQGAGSGLIPSATVRDAIKLAESWARRESDLLPKKRQASLRARVVRLANARPEFREVLLGALERTAGVRQDRG